MHHGTPSDATCWADWDDLATQLGVRVVSVSRPGYATSTRQPGRSVADCAADAADVLSQLGVDSFRTVGWSGGGPHALACGALLKERCRAIATLAGVAPYDAEGLDFLEGMGPENIDEFSVSLQGEEALMTWMKENAEEFREVTAEQIVESFGGLVPEIDKAALIGAYAEHMAAEMRRALQHGFDGWVDDDLAFTGPWGFDLAAIDAPVTVWQGDLDLMVPRAHGQWLVQHIPTAVSRMPEGHGHISLVTEYRGQILRELLAA
jgi:pimeloyl-ACP methyl ester carboxylesterase